jgi:hypothetical protein
MVFVAAGMDVLDNVQFRNLIDFNIEMFLGLASCYTPGELLFCNLCFFCFVFNYRSNSLNAIATSFALLIL